MINEVINASMPASSMDNETVRRNVKFLYDLTHGNITNLTNNLTDLAAFISYTNQNLDDFFFLVNGILVLLMQTGFACLEAGSVRAKNVTNIMLKNYLDCLICSIVFWLTGYGLAFGHGNAFIGWTWLACQGLPDRLWSEWFFQYTFASTASTILSGAVAERSSFVTYLTYSVLMSGIIYPIPVHWVWSEQGWLRKMGFVDFAGGMLIHGIAGSACLVAATIIRPRIGRFHKNGGHQTIPGHSTALVGIGGIIIFVGFTGFNAGTLSHYSQPGDGYVATKVIRNTLMEAAGASLTVLFAGKLGLFEKKSWHFAYTINGGIAGLVASCAGCNVFTPLEAIIDGIGAGIVYMLLHYVILFFKSITIRYIFLMTPWIRVPFTWAAVYGVSFLYHCYRMGFGVQAIGVLAIMAWSFAASILLFGSLNMFGLLRSSEEDEMMGSDLSKHNEPAYYDLYPKTNPD